MKVTLDKSALLGALGHAQSIVERKQTIPILGNVLLEAAVPDDASPAERVGRIAVTTNNLDMQIVLSVPAETAEPGAVTVPAHGLTDVVKRMADGPVKLETVEGGRLRVTSGRSKIHLFTLPASDFPVLAAEENAEAFALAGPVLRKLIDRTRFAMHADEKFYNLCGIYLYRPDKGRVAAATTDKHRMARQIIELAGSEAGTGAADYPKLPGTILPAKFVNQLRRLVDEDVGAIDFAIGAKRITARGQAGWILTAKLYEEAKFPPIDKAIPDWDVPLEIDASELAAAVTRVGGICVGKQRLVTWHQADNMLTLSARDHEMGDAVEELACDYAGPERTYGFNPKYLSDQLQSVDGAIRFFSDEPMKHTRIEIAADPLATFALAQIPVAGGQ